MRVWFAPHDLPIGSWVRPAMDESIRIHDKLLLMLSEMSVSSQWVEQEVETALAREEGKSVLFPIRIDDAVMESKAGWPALLKNTRNVGDFTRWKDHDSYQRAFERLLRGHKAGALSLDVDTQPTEAYIPRASTSQPLPAGAPAGLTRPPDDNPQARRLVRAARTALVTIIARRLSRWEATS